MKTRADQPFTGNEEICFVALEQTPARRFLKIDLKKTTSAARLTEWEASMTEGGKLRDKARQTLNLANQIPGDEAVLKLRETAAQLNQRAEQLEIESSASEESSK